MFRFTELTQTSTHTKLDQKPRFFVSLRVQMFRFRFELHIMQIDDDADGSIDNDDDRRLSKRTTFVVWKMLCAIYTDWNQCVRRFIMLVAHRTGRVGQAGRLLARPPYFFVLRFKCVLHSYGCWWCWTDGRTTRSSPACEPLDADCAHLCAKAQEQPCDHHIQPTRGNKCVTTRGYDGMGKGRDRSRPSVVWVQQMICAWLVHFEFNASGRRSGWVWNGIAIAICSLHFRRNNSVPNSAIPIHSCTHISCVLSTSVDYHLICTESPLHKLFLYF